ncbi:MAG TPA: hypothetical protein VH951_06975 [Dehalococcoidia bacterium]
MRFLVGFLIGLAAGYVLVARPNVERDERVTSTTAQPVTAS